MYAPMLNFVRRTRLFLLLVLLSSSCFSQKIWTLEDCINYAFDNNLDIKKQVLNVETNKAQLLQSALSMLPNINANGTNFWNYGQTVDRYTNQFATSNVRSNNFNLSTDVTIFNGFSMLNTVRQNNINLLASNYDLDVIKNNISLSVAGYYLDILFNMELYDVANNQLSITQDQVKRIQKMVDAGSSAKGDLLNIQAQASTEELAVIETENRLYISLLSLQQLIDLAVSKDFTIEKPQLKAVEAPKEILTPDQIYSYSLNVRPEIKSADLRVQSAEKSLSIARGRITPTLTFGGSWATGYSSAISQVVPGAAGDTSFMPIGYRDPSGGIVYTPYPSVSYPTQTAPFGDQLKLNENKSIGFNLSIPIYNGWSGRTAINQAKIMKSQAELDLEMRKRDLRKTIEQSYADATAALKKYKASEQKVASQEESFKYTQQKFDVGMLTSFDFNTAKKDLAKAQSDLLQAKYDFIFKTTILDFYMGKPISINN
jgi:outer membrane protein